MSARGQYVLFNQPAQKPTFTFSFQGLERELRVRGRKRNKSLHFQGEMRKMPIKWGWKPPMNCIHGLYVNLEKHSFHYPRTMARSPLKQ